VVVLGARAGLAGMAAGLPAAWGAWGATGGRAGRVVEPFTLGVASGDPVPDGVVLWTRLAPDPLLQGGAMPNRPILVRWEVAHDERFGRVAAKGTVHARPESAHAVHVEVAGLGPGREYFYRFKTGQELSPIGRTKTAPRPDQDPRRLAFAFASCQMYEHGYFTAFGHMAQEDLDFVVHLGDYIYEHGQNQYAGRSGNVRLHAGGEIESLEDYRRRHAQYKTDSDLQAAHAAFPWIVTFDDHEIDNNWAGGVPENTAGPNATRESFLARRAAAFQAYYEHMPLRRGTRPVGPDMLAYRRLTFGRMAQFSALDTRQYRSDQACGDGSRVDCAARLDPARTMTGPAQERWLLDGLERSRARWNVVAQQVFMAQRDTDPGPPQQFSMDSWDGYRAGRDRLLAHVQSRGVPNPIVLTGDVHRSWVADLKADFDDPASATIGTEFVGSSISSTGDGTGENQDAVLAANPHLKFFEDQRGYMRCVLDAERWRTDVRVVPYVSRPGAPITTSASFAVIDGAAGALPA
jgi:alkaline phosphatase D